jgi:group I intron endonuclease
LQTLTKSGFVYLWVNTVNQKKYLGSHVGAQNDGYTGSGKIFLRAVRKYGIERFVRIILEADIAADDVITREQLYLDISRAASDPTFYNIRRVAGGGFEHINEGPEAKRIRARAVKAANAWRAENGHPKGMLGKKHSDATKAQMAHSIREAVIALKGRPVLQFTLDGEFVAEHRTITEGAKAVGGSPSNIKYTCEGRFKKAYGYKWSYPA